MKLLLIDVYKRQEEAMGIVNDIAAKTEHHEAEYKDFAVLYRTDRKSVV